MVKATVFFFLFLFLNLILLFFALKVCSSFLICLSCIALCFDCARALGEYIRKIALQLL